MPVVAMQVSSKTAHEKTDKLFIYTFTAPGHDERTIVANLTTVYEVGDVAAIAVTGTFLEEGSIEPRKVFGIHSEGMALGPVEAELGADLTAQFDADREPHPIKVTVEMVVEARYATDAIKAARKRIGKGDGEATAVDV